MITQYDIRDITYVVNPDQPSTLPVVPRLVGVYLKGERLDARVRRLTIVVDADSGDCYAEIETREGGI